MDNYDFSPILERLKSEKKRSGMTNDQLSDASGVPIGTLRKILSGGTQEPKLPALMAIASALGTSVDFLVYGRSSSASPFELKQEEIQLIMDFRSMNLQGQTAALSNVRGLSETPMFKKGDSPTPGAMDAL